jgi:predicted RNA binding protein YcfA (HicA-like mRNA interferase family)
VRQLLMMLKRDGWVFRAQRGSHHHFVHPTKSGRVTVAYSSRSEDIPTAIQKSIFKQAGWK